ncbi:MAG TPA: hypothetical protein VJN92_21165 [Candidatus Acidoferrum sp.]|nr:hypothetical protein [Candidatus Acidoferrum sp.]
MDRPSQRFDRQLFTLKVSELTHQMQTKSVACDRIARSRKTGGSILLNTVDGQLVLLHEWLEAVDHAAREVWQVQGEAVTPQFVRDVLLPAAIDLIGGRHSAVSFNITSSATRTGGTQEQQPAQQHLAREFEKLKAEMNTATRSKRGHLSTWRPSLHRLAD